MDPYPDVEDMEDVTIYEERECHWRMFLEENDRGMNDQKAILRVRGGMNI